jgi:hypothetical protein
MKKKLILFCLFSIAFFCKVSAQVIPPGSNSGFIPPRNGVYLEVGGNAVMGSINYERLIYLPGTAPNFALRVGMLPMYARENNNTNYLHLYVPLELTLIPGKNRVSPEFGAGITILNTHTRNKLENNEFSQDMMPVFRAGVRWNLENKPLYFRAALLLLNIGAVDDFREGATMPWVSYCIGYRFGKKKK